MSGLEPEPPENLEVPEAPENTETEAVSPFVLVGDSDAATCADGACAIPDKDN